MNKMSPNQPLIQISVPNLGEEEVNAVREVFSSGWLTQGPRVKLFEEQFAQRHQSKYAIATTSCTSALHTMLNAAGIGPGDEVIVPSFTWIATANAVIYTGATPVLVDIDLDSFNINLNCILERITPKTKAIIVVHLFGYCVDINFLKLSIGNPDILIFEDAACAAGASINGQSAGSMGEAASFSFHPRKSITTGEGGMVTTNSFELYESSKQFRNHGANTSAEDRHLSSKPYFLPDFDVLGYNYRMTDIQAAIGIVQLAKLDSILLARQKIAANYSEALRDFAWVHIPRVPEGMIHSWQSFVIRIDKNNSKQSRNELMEQLLSSGITTRPGTHAIHELSYYKDNFKIDPTKLKNSKESADSTISLPMHDGLSERDIDFVVDSLTKLN